MGGENIKASEICELLEKFQEINKMGWIKSMRKGTTGIGYTFETLIGKEEDTITGPDFKSIEIKVKRKYGYGTVTLFNAVPDNKEKMVNEIYELYGVFNKNKNYYKTFMVTIDTTFMKRYGKHYFQLKVDKKEEKIRMEIYDENKNLIRDDISWSYQLLEDKINKKMKNLALIKAKIKRENDIIYYNYYDISFYEMKEFKEFINAIKLGKVKITFKMSAFIFGERTGEMDNHGVGFDINERCLDLIYKKRTTNSRF